MVRTSRQCLLMVLLFAGVSVAHKGNIHDLITRESCDVASHSLGLQFQLADPKGDVDCIRAGSVEEDLYIRFSEHHYNPHTGDGMVLHLPVFPYIIFFKTAIGLASDMWSEEVLPHFADPANRWAGDGHGSFHYLGRVSHLLQDMGAPPHVHAPKGHGPEPVWPLPTLDPWASDFEDYWSDDPEDNPSPPEFPYVGDHDYALFPSDGIPSTRAWGSKLDNFSWSRMRTRIGSKTDSVEDFVKTVAWITYFHSSYYGEVRKDTGNATPSLTTQTDIEGYGPGVPNTLYTMFNSQEQSHLQYDSFYDNWVIDGIGWYDPFDLFFDDWWPCPGDTVGTFSEGTITGRFYIYQTWADEGAYPDAWPNGELNSTNKVLAQYYGEFLFPIAARYNAGLLKQAYRTISGRVTNSSGTAGISSVSITTQKPDATSDVYSASTDSQGYYTLSVHYNWSGRVFPSKTGYTFVPASHYYAAVTSNLSYGNDFKQSTGPVVPSYIVLTLILNPSSTTPGGAVISSGTAYYDTGTAVPAATVTITASSQTYTAAVSNGSYSRTISAPSSSGPYTVYADANDGQGRTGSASAPLQVTSGGGGSGFTFNQALMCRDRQSSDPWMYIYPTEVFGEPDSKITCWFELTDVYGAHSGEDKWYRPDGSLCGSGIFNIPDSKNNNPPYDYWSTYRLGKYISIDTSILDSEGEWKVKIYIDGNYQRSLKFYVRYDLTQHRMCKNVDNGDPWMYHDPTNIFYQTDEKVVAWYQFEFVRQDLELKWKAYEPSGALYKPEWTGHVDDPAGSGYDYWNSWRHATWFTLNGTTAAQKCGDWHIQFLVQDVYENWDLEYTDYFQILENPALRPTVSASGTPGVPVETQPVTVTISANDNTYLKKVILYWKVDGSQIPPHTMQDGIYSGSYSGSYGIGSFSASQQVEYWADACDTSGNSKESAHTTFIVQPETISTPARPTGASSLRIGQNGTYITGGSNSSLGHSIWYQFDWGDGSQSVWGSATQSHSWSSEGFYAVKARAQCQTHTNRISGWSDLFMVTVEFESPKLLYVDDNAPNDPGPGDPRVSDPGEDGSAEHPFDAIQEAIGAAYDGDVVIVLDGTYTSTGNRDIDFGGKAITLRSENGPDNCIIDCNGTEAEPHRGFYFHSGEDANSVVHGFTIRNGYASEDVVEGTVLEPGGAIYCNNSSPTIIRCIITNNSARHGGAIFCAYSGITITSSVIKENTVERHGGGIYCVYDTGNTPKIANCVFAGNSADVDGGGIRCWESDPTIVNCTFSQNVGLNGGAIALSSNSSPSLINCILWANSATSSGYEIFRLSNCTPTFRYCDIRGCGESGVGWNSSLGTDGGGNIDDDPNFADPSNNDYHLKSEAGRWDPNSQSWVQDDVTSPCIDAGDPNSDWTAELWPNGKRINMGAYGGTPEASMSLSDIGNIANLDNDTSDTVDFSDLGIFVSKWCYEEFLMAEDLNRDGIVNLIDFTIFAEHWLEGVVQVPPKNCEGYVSLPSYGGDCGSRPPGTVCVGYVDGYIWLVTDSIAGWSDATDCQGRAVRIAHGTSGTDYYHVLDTLLVKEF